MKQKFATWLLLNRRRLSTLGILGSVVLIATVTVAFKAPQDDYFFKVSKSLDIFGRVYKEIAVNYVDEVDPEKFMESGIDGMLETLDPYTNFINESEGDEVELITTGTYGGIGVTIGVRDNYITVITLMDGYSAQRQGIMPGDKIIEVEGKDVVGTKPEAVRALTRGDVGSEMHMKVIREGEKDPLSFTLVREEIHLKNVTYADFVDSGVAYIRVEHFARAAGNEVRMAIQDLRARGQIKQVVLDLRGNPGGLLDAAVEIVSKFVPKGSTVVTTRGRKPETERKYLSIEEPILPKVPLVVLVNGNSASASEIVAGAIQDLDRGVVVGTRSFGKGLVQTISPLSYNTQLKITTAKYYTPSGRCIQEIDYLRKGKEGGSGITADSLRHEFKTATGRIVHERGGISPDSTVEEAPQSTIDRELTRKLLFFRFVTSYVASHKDNKSSLTITDDVMRQFQEYISREKFTYQDDGEKRVADLAEFAEKGKYGQSVKDEIARLQKEFAAERNSDFKKHYDEIRQDLAVELAARIGGENGRIATGLKDDPQLAAAVAIARTESLYGGLLSVKKH